MQSFSFRETEGLLEQRARALAFTGTFAPKAVRNGIHALGLELPFIQSTVFSWCATIAVGFWLARILADVSRWWRRRSVQRGIESCFARELSAEERTQARRAAFERWGRPPVWPWVLMLAAAVILLRERLIFAPGFRVDLVLGPLYEAGTLKHASSLVDGWRSLGRRGGDLGRWSPSCVVAGPLRHVHPCSSRVLSHGTESMASPLLRRLRKKSPMSSKSV